MFHLWGLPNILGRILLGVSVRQRRARAYLYRNGEHWSCGGRWAADIRHRAAVADASARGPAVGRGGEAQDIVHEPSAAWQGERAAITPIAPLGLRREPASLWTAPGAGAQRSAPPPSHPLAAG